MMQTVSDVPGLLCKRCARLIQSPAGRIGSCWIEAGRCQDQDEASVGARAVGGTDVELCPDFCVLNSDGDEVGEGPEVFERARDPLVVDLALRPSGNLEVHVGAVMVVLGEPGTSGIAGVLAKTLSEAKQPGACASKGPRLGRIVEVVVESKLAPLGSGDPVDRLGRSHNR